MGLAFSVSAFFGSAFLTGFVSGLTDSVCFGSEAIDATALVSEGLGSADCVGFVASGLAGEASVAFGFEEPLVLSVPDTDGRYYVIALFDMWTNIFASIGSRTTGTEAGHFLIAGPNWQGSLPPDVKQVYRSPSRFVWVNGQMRADGPKDYDVVNPLQNQC